MKSLHFVEKHRLAWRESPDLRVAGPLEAIVHPIAATTCDLDRSIISGVVDFGRDFPLGHECVAEVLDVGSGVSRIEPGDVCVVPWHINWGTCGACRRGLTAACTAFPELSGYGVPLGGDWDGLFTEQVRVPFADAMLTTLPATVEPVPAASCGDNLTDAYIAVWSGLSRHPGAAVLVVSGLPSLGLFAVQHAIALGASHVTFVDHREHRRELARALGADVHPDVQPNRDHARYPVVIGANPQPARLPEAIACVAPGGHFSNLAMVFGDAPMPLWTMYQRDMSFSTGFASIAPHVDAVLNLIGTRRIRPEAVVTEHAWDDAPEVLLESHPKPVLVVRVSPRERVARARHFTRSSRREPANHDPVEPS